MKILASGDHHFDEHDPRWEECLRVHTWMIETAKRKGVELFLGAGDLYERASTPIERQAVADWLVAMANVCPVVLVRGNHDAVHDLEIFSRLQAAHPIRIVERTAVLTFGDVVVGAVAWPSRASIAKLAESAGVEADTAAEHLYANVLRGIGAEMDRARPSYRVLLAHAMVDGSVTSVGQPLIGAEMRIGLDVLGMARADATVLGHIHKPQAWNHGGGTVLYTGSPFPTAYGESEEKSVVLIDTDERTVRRVATPATKMVLVDGSICKGGDGVLLVEYADGDKREAWANADIRFRYTVNAEDALPAKTLAANVRERMVAAGAVAVKVEAVVNAVTRARAPEVTRATTYGEKLDVLWASRRMTIDPTARERLFAKLDELRAA